MAQFCDKCGNETGSDAQYCSGCGASLAEKVKPKSFALDLGASQKQAGAALLVLFLVAGAGMAGFFHFVQSSSNGLMLVRKPHFTFGETFVSMDEITNMPLIAAKAKYPLTVRALQDADIIESDEEMRARIEADVRAEMNKAMGEAQREFEKTYDDLLRKSGLK